MSAGSRVARLFFFPRVLVSATTPRRSSSSLVLSLYTRQSLTNCTSMVVLRAQTHSLTCFHKRARRAAARAHSLISSHFPSIMPATLLGLPIEIKIRVAKLVIASDPDSTRVSLKSLIFITHVCRHLRFIFVNAQELWNYVDFS